MIKSLFQKYVLRLILLSIFCGGVATYAGAESISSDDRLETVIQEEQVADDPQDAHAEEGEPESDHPEAAPWSVIPFVLLLGMIATGPLFYEHFWHKNYPKIAVLLGAIVVAYYFFFLHNQHAPVHAFFEYVQFISLLTGLYIASGSIMIGIDKKATPMTNSTLLVVGAIIANVIGTIILSL